MRPPAWSDLPGFPGLVRPPAEWSDLGPPVRPPFGGPHRAWCDFPGLVRPPQGLPGLADLPRLGQTSRLSQASAGFVRPPRLATLGPPRAWSDLPPAWFDLLRAWSDLIGFGRTHLGLVRPPGLVRPGSWPQPSGLPGLVGASAAGPTRPGFVRPPQGLVRPRWLSQASSGLVRPPPALSGLPAWSSPGLGATSRLARPPRGLVRPSRLGRPPGLGEPPVLVRPHRAWCDLPALFNLAGLLTSRLGSTSGARSGLLRFGQLPSSPPPGLSQASSAWSELPAFPTSSGLYYLGRLGRASVLSDLLGLGGLRFGLVRHPADFVRPPSGAPPGLVRRPRLGQASLRPSDLIEWSGPMSQASRVWSDRPALSGLLGFGPTSSGAVGGFLRVWSGLFRAWSGLLHLVGPPAGSDPPGFGQTFLGLVRPLSKPSDLLGLGQASLQVWSGLPGLVRPPVGLVRRPQVLEYDLRFSGLPAWWSFQRRSDLLGLGPTSQGLSPEPSGLVEPPRKWWTSAAWSSLPGLVGLTGFGGPPDLLDLPAWSSLPGLVGASGLGQASRAWCDLPGLVDLLQSGPTSRLGDLPSWSGLARAWSRPAWWASSGFGPTSWPGWSDLPPAWFDLLWAWFDLSSAWCDLLGFGQATPAWLEPPGRVRPQLSALCDLPGFVQPRPGLAQASPAWFDLLRAGSDLSGFGRTPGGFIRPRPAWWTRRVLSEPPRAWSGLPRQWTSMTLFDLSAWSDLLRAWYDLPACSEPPGCSGPSLVDLPVQARLGRRPPGRSDLLQAVGPPPEMVRLPPALVRPPPGLVRPPPALSDLLRVWSNLLGACSDFLRCDLRVWSTFYWFGRPPSRPSPPGFVRSSAGWSDLPPAWFDFLRTWFDLPWLEPPAGLVRPPDLVRPPIGFQASSVLDATSAACSASPAWSDFPAWSDLLGLGPTSPGLGQARGLVGLLRGVVRPPARRSGLPAWSEPHRVWWDLPDLLDLPAVQPPGLSGLPARSDLLGLGATSRAWSGRPGCQASCGSGPSLSPVRPPVLVDLTPGLVSFPACPASWGLVRPLQGLVRPLPGRQASLRVLFDLARFGPTSPRLGSISQAWLDLSWLECDLPRFGPATRLESTSRLAVRPRLRLYATSTGSGAFSGLVRPFPEFGQAYSAWSDLPQQVRPQLSALCDLPALFNLLRACSGLPAWFDLGGGSEASLGFGQNSRGFIRPRRLGPTRQGFVRPRQGLVGLPRQWASANFVRPPRLVQASQGVRPPRLYSTSRLAQAQAWSTSRRLVRPRRAWSGVRGLSRPHGPVGPPGMVHLPFSPTSGASRVLFVSPGWSSLPGLVQSPQGLVRPPGLVQASRGLSPTSRQVRPPAGLVRPPGFRPHGLVTSWALAYWLAQASPAVPPGWSDFPAWEAIWLGPGVIPAVGPQRLGRPQRQVDLTPGLVDLAGLSGTSPQSDFRLGRPHRAWLTSRGWSASQGLVRAQGLVEPPQDVVRPLRGLVEPPRLGQPLWGSQASYGLVRTPSFGGASWGVVELSGLVSLPVLVRPPGLVELPRQVGLAGVGGGLAAGWSLGLVGLIRFSANSRLVDLRRQSDLLRLVPTSCLFRAPRAWWTSRGLGPTRGSFVRPSRSWSGLRLGQASSGLVGLLSAIRPRQSAGDLAGRPRPLRVWSGLRVWSDLPEVLTQEMVRPPLSPTSAKLGPASLVDLLRVWSDLIGLVGPHRVWSGLIGLGGASPAQCDLIGLVGPPPGFG
ncbi:hypothetical protein FNV43_RR12158 [Rhamnella rubrinervis]|uniref:Uncharacterized protein n=1 Tax=Rhamnella rubrinervis TaxID=2594499 RepID=A0A8K0MIJ7_9ROSA|nr:hypothetical protein FNV43_RR12158 [Rhamnella rubrinervis]